MESLLAQAKENDIAPSELLDEKLVPMVTAVEGLPSVNLTIDSASYFILGQAVQVAGAPSEGLVQVNFGDSQEFVGIGTINDDGLVAPKRLVTNSSLHQQQSCD